MQQQQQQPPGVDPVRTIDQDELTTIGARCWTRSAAVSVCRGILDVLRPVVCCAPDSASVNSQDALRSHDFNSDLYSNLFGTMQSCKGIASTSFHFH